MATRPAEFLDWITGGGAAIIDPPSGVKNVGWQIGESPPSQYTNWQINLIDQWLQYLDSVAQGWPNHFVDSEATLASAISDCASDGGGVICVVGPFAITTAKTIPINTVVVGRGGLSVITLQGSAVINLSDQDCLRDVYFETTITTGNLVVMAGASVTIWNCQFTVTPANTVVCVSVQGSGCGIQQSIFRGVLAPSTCTGIEFEAGFVDSYERDNSFY